MADDRVQCFVYKVPDKRKYYEVCGKQTGEVDDNGNPVFEVISDRDVTNKLRSRF